MAKKIKSVEQSRTDHSVDDRTMTEIATDLAAGTAALFARTAVVTVAAGMGVGGFRSKAAASVDKAPAKGAPKKKAAKKNKAKSAIKSLKMAAKSSKKVLKKSGKNIGAQKAKKRVAKTINKTSGKKSSRKSKG